MSLFAEVSGVRIVSGVIVIPECGLWTADVSLEKEATLASSLTVKLAGLELVGAAFRSGGYSGRTRARLVGGRGLWGELIGPKGYRNSAGVKLSTVLGDAAREVGETISVETDRVIGPHFARLGDPALGGRAPACRLLNLLASSYYAAPNGTTVVGTRASSAISSTFELVDLNRAAGIAVVATEKPEDFAPGRTFTSSRASGTFTIRAVTHKINGSTIRSEVML